MFALKMALRNLRRQKRRTFFTGMMMVGGFFLTSVYLGVNQGTYGSIIDLFTRDHTGHLQVHVKGYLDNPSLQATLDGWEGIRGALSKDPEVVSAAPRLYAAALAFTGSKTTGTRIVGVDPALEASTTRLKRKVSEGSYFPEEGTNRALAGRGLARALGITVGSEVALVGQGADGSVANDLFTVVGLVGPEGEGSSDRDLYLRLPEAQLFLALPGRVHEVAVLLKDIDLAEKKAASLARALGDPRLSVEPWQVVESGFYNAMVTDRKGDSVSLFIFILMVSMGILNTVLMNVLERTPEYGLLKALGTRSSTIASMIALEMTILALLSLLPGSALSLAANLYLERHGFALTHTFTFGGMDFTTLYGKVFPAGFLYPSLLVVAVAFLVCLPAAWRVHRLTPIEALRRA